MAGMGGIFFKCPELIVVSSVALGGLRVGPEAVGGNVLAGILADERRALAEQFDALAGAFARGAGDEAIPRLAFSGRDFRHYLPGFAAALFTREDVVAAVVVAAVVEQERVGGDALLEIGEVLAGFGCPAGFGNGHEARQGEVFHEVAVGYVFRPERALHARVVGGLRSGDIGGYGFLRIRALHIVRTVAGKGGLGWVGALLAVDVVGTPRREHVVQTEFGCFACAGCGRLPAEHGCARFLNQFCVGVAGRNRLVPHDGLLAMFFQEVGHFLDEVALQLAIVGQSQFPVFGLTFCVALPLRGGAFVAADVEVVVREEGNEFGKNVLGKLHSGGVGHVEHVGGNAAVDPHRGSGLGVAAIFGVRSHGGNEVTGHIHLGNYLDVAFLGISHHVLNLLLGVEVRAVNLIGPIGAVLEVGDIGVRCRCADGGELWILLDLHAPALVVGEVPVEAVHFVIRHHVEHALHLFHGEEVAGHVEHETAIGKARLVLNGDAGQGVLGDGGVLLAGHDIGGQNFLDRLEGIVETKHALGTHGHLALVDHEVVSTFVHRAGIERHVKKRSLSIGLCHGVVARGGVEVEYEALHLCHHFGGECTVVTYHKVLWQNYLAREHGHSPGSRREVYEIVGGRDARRQNQGHKNPENFVFHSNYVGY